MAARPSHSHSQRLYKVTHADFTNWRFLVPYTIALVGMTPKSNEEYATSLLRWIQRNQDKVGDLEERLFGSGGIKHDYVDLNVGRDFLKENKTYDMVILGNIWHPDPGEVRLESGIFAVSPQHGISTWKRRLVGTKAEIIGVFGSDLGGDQIGDLPGYTRYRKDYMTSVYVRNNMKNATTLRGKIIRLAHSRPDLRPQLLPLLKEAYRGPYYRDPISSTQKILAELSRMKPGEAMRISDMERAMGVPWAAVETLFNKLVQMGYLVQEDRGHFAPTIFGRDWLPVLKKLATKTSSFGRENAKRMFTNWYSQKKNQSAEALLDNWFKSKCRNGITSDILNAIYAEEKVVNSDPSLVYGSFTNKDLSDVIYAHIKRNYGVTDAFAKGIALQIAFGENY